LKKDFKPDLVFVDYINICASSRFRAGANVNSYTYIKAIAEEMRGLAVEYNLPIMSATQTTRTGFVSTDVGLEDTSESFGLPATADFMFALISSDELNELNQMLVKQLKNRYADPTMNKKFILATADFMFALISSDELNELNQMLVKQLKNRYADPTMNKKFILGVDRAKMKLYDVSQTAQEDLVDTGQDEEVIDRFANFKV